MRNFMFRWDAILYLALFVGMLLTAYNFLISLPNNQLTVALIAFGAGYTFAAIIRLIKLIILKKCNAFRYWAFPLYSTLTVVYLIYLHHNNMENLSRTIIISYILILVIVALSIFQTSIWLYKRHEARKAQTVQETDEALPQENEQPYNIKKFFSSYWDTMFYSVFFGIIFFAPQNASIIWPANLLFLVLSSIFTLIVFVRLAVAKKHDNLRCWIYPLYGVSTIFYLADVLYNNAVNLGLAAVLMGIFFGFSIARVSIWLYKHHQAKKAAVVPEAKEETPDEDS